MSEIKLVYVAGPYSAQEPSQVAINIGQAWFAGRELVKMGLFPVIPHMNTAFFEGLQDYDFFLEGTFRLLSQCDAMLVLPGYENSDGTLREIRKASMSLYIPIFYSFKEVREWLDKEIGT